VRRSSSVSYRIELQLIRQAHCGVAGEGQLDGISHLNWQAESAGNVELTPYGGGASRRTSVGVGVSLLSWDVVFCAVGPEPLLTRTIGV
jgi:hypothetical protein